MKMTKNKNCTRYYSALQEKQVAKKLGGKVNANSGATDFIKGDIRLEDILVECKTVMEDKKSVSIKADWLTKLREEAFAMNKPYTMLAFNFKPGGEIFYVLDEKFIYYIIELMNKEKLNGN